MQKFSLVICCLLLVGCSAISITTPTPALSPEWQAYNSQVQNALDFGGKNAPAENTYECFADGYSPDFSQPVLPAANGPYGEPVYDLNGIAVSVFSVGPHSLAPTNVLYELLQAQGMLGNLVFPVSGDKYHKLREIHFYLYNVGINLTPGETQVLQIAFPYHYTLLDQGRVGENVNLFQMLPTVISGADFVESQAKFENFVELQKVNKIEIKGEYVLRAQEGKEEASNYTSSEKCNIYASLAWQNKIDSVNATYEAYGLPPIPFAGTWHRYTKDGWASGEWGAIFLVNISDYYIGVDQGFIVEGIRTTSYSYVDGTPTPFDYGFTRIAGGILCHEFSHPVIGDNEILADRGAQSCLRWLGNRYKSGDLRVPMVLIKRDTGDILPLSTVP